MKLKDLEKKALECVKIRYSKKNIPINADRLMLHLMEEVGELTLQINNEKLKREKLDVKNIGEEISDCMVLLIALADYYNLDLEDSINQKIKETNNRK